MKKRSWILILATCLVAAICALVGACGVEPAGPTAYTVTASAGDGYTVAG